MRPEIEDAGLLWDMLQASREALAFIEGKSLDEYLSSLVLMRAIEREIEIVGEAARALSQAFKQAHPEVPWQKIIGQRHVLAHDYGTIDHLRLWEVVSIKLPELVRHLEQFLSETPPETLDQL